MVFEQIQTWIHTYLPNVYAQALVIIFLSVVIAKGVVYVSRLVLAKMAAKTKSKVDDILLERLSSPLFWLILVFGCRVALAPLTLSEQISVVLTNLIQSAIIFIVVRVIAIFAEVIFEHWGKSWSKKTTSKVDDQIIRTVLKTIKYVQVMVAFLMILGVWGIEVGPFIASLGIAGVAVAFALQTTLGNMFGGMSLVVDKTYDIDDVVEVDGISGVVVDIGLRSTKIRTWDNELVSIPNGTIANGRVKNFLKPSDRIRVVVPFGVAYGSDVDKVRDIVLKELKDIDGYIEEPAPFIYFKEMADSSLNFIAYFWVSDFTKKWMAGHDANTKIYKALNKAGIEIPFPQLDVHMKNK